MRFSKTVSKILGFVPSQILYTGIETTDAAPTYVALAVGVRMGPSEIAPKFEVPNNESSL